MVALATEAAKAFQLHGEAETIVPFGGGHINDTFLVTTAETSYILQRVNKFVFKHPEAIMQNIEEVTAFIRKKLEAAGRDPLKETLNLIHTKEDQPYYIDSSGEYWRATTYIENTTAYEYATSPEMLFESGYAFGSFQNLLSDYPAESLHEVIPEFHNTPARFGQLMDAINRDPKNRVRELKTEIQFAKDREEDAGALMKLLNAGELPLKVTHNDTKMSNVLIDNTTGKGLCVIDLDTVMPGLTAFDFGDSIRAGASTGAEDEVDLTKVNFSLELFEAYTKGFLKAAGAALTPLELETLPLGAKLMTYEVGIRFLADYINGDIYFKTKYETHNLDRARNQFKLVADMERQWDAMMEIIHKYA